MLSFVSTPKLYRGFVLEFRISARSNISLRVQPTMNRTLSSTLFAVSLCTAIFLWGNSPARAIVAPTITTLTSSVNPVVIGQPVTYTVMVTTTGRVPLTGPVAISFNGTYGPNYTLNNGAVVVTRSAAAHRRRFWSSQATSVMPIPPLPARRL